MSPTPPPPHRDLDAEDALKSVLASDELPQWSARPSAAAIARLQPRLVVLGVFWTFVWGAGFYGFADTLLGAEYDGTPRVLRLLALLVAGAPFLAVTLYGLGGHVLLLRRRCRRTVYAVTPQRLIVQRPLLGACGPLRVRSLPRERIGEVVLEADEQAGPTLEVHDADRVETPLLLTGLTATECVRDLLVTR